MPGPLIITQTQYLQLARALTMARRVGERDRRSARVSALLEPLVAFCRDQEPADDEPSGIDGPRDARGRYLDTAETVRERISRLEAERAQRRLDRYTLTVDDDTRVALVALARSLTGQPDRLGLADTALPVLAWLTR